MNQLQIFANIIERDILRYTPAGVPVVSAKLMHSSKQMEAGIERLVEFEMTALVVGEISGRFNHAELGSAHQFTGFLARKSRNSKSLVFHIIDF